MQGSLNVFQRLKKLQQGSVRYLQDNQKQVCKMNQLTLVGLNIFYFVVVFAYLVASQTVFASWNVDKLYLVAVLLQIPLMMVVIIRYHRKVRDINEVNSVCMIFQLYVMVFVGIMCIFPLELNQPAVYFAPIGLGFAVAFTYTFYQTLILALVEACCYMAVSSALKEPGTFTVDVSSSILFFILAVYVAKILYQNRISENEARQRIRLMGMIDGLTSVYNKASTEFLCKGFLKNQPRQQCVAIILDFDNFKYVNDNYGHQTGDAVLKSFGKILKHVAGDEHIAGRIGGDEFFLFLKNCGTEEATQVAQRVLTETRALRAPDGTTPFSCSIGIAVKNRFGGGGQEPEKYAELFARADQALYIVKECGKNNYNFADE